MSPAQRNGKAVWAFLTALLSLAALAGIAVAARRYDELRVQDAVAGVPVALAFGLASVILGRRARAQYDRSLGRSGRRGFIWFARLLGAVALLLAVTAALALAVFAVLVLVLE